MGNAFFVMIPCLKYHTYVRTRATLYVATLWGHKKEIFKSVSWLLLFNQNGLLYFSTGSCKEASYEFLLNLARYFQRRSLLKKLLTEIQINKDISQ